MREKRQEEARSVDDGVTGKLPCLNSSRPHRPVLFFSKFLPRAARLRFNRAPRNESIRVGIVGMGATRAINPKLQAHPITVNKNGVTSSLKVLTGHAVID
jgi:hypothetical protein